MFISGINSLDFYTNNKTGDLYQVVGFVRDATNASGYQLMVEYYKIGDELNHVREINEFKEKFTIYK